MGPDADKYAATKSMKDDVDLPLCNFSRPPEKDADQRNAALLRKESVRLWRVDKQDVPVILILLPQQVRGLQY
jgi:hypothetical protein